MVVVGSALAGIAKNTGTANGLVFDIVQGAEQFTIGTVHVWLVARERDTVEDAGGLVENAVHLLQGTHGGLWEEKVDHGDHEGVAERCVS